MTVYNISIFVAIIIGTFILAFIINRIFSAWIQRSSGIIKNDPTNYLFLKHAVSALIYLVGLGSAIYWLPSLRTLASSLLAGAGIFAVAVGFASQHALSNIISGIFIVVFKPFRINDRLTLRQTMSGIVEDITLRHTVIRDFENRRIIIPNAVISDEIIINADFTDDKICKWIDLTINFESDIDVARKIIQEKIEKHPLAVDPRSPEAIEEGQPRVTVRVVSIGESGINLRAWAWAKNSPDAFVLGCDLYETIKKRFDVEGIRLSYPHRAIIQKKL